MSWPSRECYLSLSSPTDININMMPYIYGGKEFQDYKFSDYLIPYFPLIKFCKSKGCYLDLKKDKGSIFYLIIQEGWVEPHETQRRPGIHIDNPGVITLKDVDKLAPQNQGNGSSTLTWYEERVGGEGVFLSSRERVGGIFMTSNVPNFCCAWNCKIEQDFYKFDRATWFMGAFKRIPSRGMTIHDRTKRSLLDNRSSTS